MGSFSFTIANFKNNTHQNIVKGEKVYIGYKDEVFQGEYQDYGRFEIIGSRLQLDVYAVEGYLIENDVSLSKATFTTDGLMTTDRKEYQRLRSLAIHHEDKYREGELSFLVLSRVKSHIPYIINYHDPEQGFGKWRRGFENGKPIFKNTWLET